jgi:hypothetical protein
MIGPTDPLPIFPVPLAQQKKPDVVQAIEVNVLIVNPLAVKDFQVTVLPLTLVIEAINGPTEPAPILPVPMAMQKVVLLQTIEENVLAVMPVWVKAVHVVPGADDPVLEKMVTAAEVVPMTKQIGRAVALGHTMLVSAVVAGIVSLVQVAVEPEIVAVRRTPFDDVPDPMAMQAGVVAPVGHTMLVSCDTPAGSGLFDQVVPLVDTAAAPPDEL